MKRKHPVKRLKSGHYLYRDYELINLGYHPDDGCVWWQAIDINTNCADFHNNTKRDLINDINDELDKEMD